MENDTSPIISVRGEETHVTEMCDDEKIEFVARRILKDHIAAFQELAK